MEVSDLLSTEPEQGGGRNQEPALTAAACELLLVDPGPGEELALD
jgi:hypothetical protein